MRKISSSTYLDLRESLTSEGGQNECSLVDLLAVVPAELVLLLGRPAAEGLLNVKVGVLGADHEADLTGGVGRDGGVGVLDGREDRLARFLEVGDDVEVQPLVLGWKVVSRCFNKRLTSARVVSAGKT
jgi:hypothetical protein